MAFYLRVNVLPLSQFGQKVHQLYVVPGREAGVRVIYLPTTTTLSFHGAGVVGGFPATVEILSEAAGVAPGK